MNWIFIAMMVAAGGDTIEIRDSSEGHAAEVYYLNSGDELSKPGRFHLEHNGVSVTVVIAFEYASDRETVTVFVDDQTLIPFPADPVPVSDGDSTVVQIMRPMF